MNPVLAALNEREIIFWDFDGVIKDSLNVKTRAFEALFRFGGNEVTARVRAHHESHGGVSRLEKIPLYLNWAGLPAEDALVTEYCHRFSSMVLQGVLDAPWVPGVREYLLEHFGQQYFVLVTATPQEEIEHILSALDIAHCFREVHGAPIKKASAIQAVLSRRKCGPDMALMIGDAETDLQAALLNSVPFLLRRTPLNLSMQTTYRGPMFDDLNNEPPAKNHSWQKPVCATV
ncbi:MAG: HAD family hydrolase [Magnetococcales bacterium]|nr:HAD family hydrolase [Magnetococcales bacterium]